MRTLNPKLYNYLRQKYGEVSVTHPGERRREIWNPQLRRIEAYPTGEAYNISCPFCGDTKRRLSISYCWLDPHERLIGKRKSHLIHCYNEDCPQVREEAFWGPIARDLDTLDFGGMYAVLQQQEEAPPPAPVEVRMPLGCQPLDTLPPDHMALTFLREKYGESFDLQLYAKEYGACYTETYDETYRLSRYRVFFPIEQEDKLIGWQGRTINKRENVRWYLSPGFRKVLYRRDRINRADPIVLAEGITSAIAMGSQASAIFGKYLDNHLQRELLKWPAVLVALDADAFYPPPPKARKSAIFKLPEAFQLHKDLSAIHPNVHLIRWPKEVMAAALAHSRGEDVKVPDAADLGPARMKEIINASF